MHTDRPPLGRGALVHAVSEAIGQDRVWIPGSVWALGRHGTRQGQRVASRKEEGLTATEIPTWRRAQKAWSLFQLSPKMASLKGQSSAKLIFAGKARHK